MRDYSWSLASIALGDRLYCRHTLFIAVIYLVQNAIDHLGREYVFTTYSQALFFSLNSRCKEFTGYLALRKLVIDIFDDWRVLKKPRSWIILPCLLHLRKLTGNLSISLLLERKIWIANIWLHGIYCRHALLRVTLHNRLIGRLHGKGLLVALV